ncbi:MAG: hypothetical protein M3P96_00700 [Actinomycetota bacterium]|nr:hypothetical protein [Actinomycetota bacterium]
MTTPANDDRTPTDARDTPTVTHGDPLADLPQTSELGEEEAQGAGQGDQAAAGSGIEDPGATEAPRGYAT